MNTLSLSLEKIKAVTLRFWYIYYNAYGRLIDICFWPLRDCLLWGLTGAWMAHQQQEGLALQAALLAGVAFWQIILRTSSCIGFAIFEEIISHNMINVLVSPLRLSEWLGGIITISSLMGIGVLLFSVLASMLLYKINILAMGAIALLATISCLFIGLALGFLAGGFMIRNGSSMFWFIYIAPWALAPFIGAYYALDALPVALQKFALYLPMSSTFNMIRAATLGQPLTLFTVSMSLFGNGLLCALAILFFVRMFHQAKQKGLVNLQ